MYAKLDEILKKLNTPVMKSDIVRKHLGNRNLHLSQYGYHYLLWITVLQQVNHKKALAIQVVVSKKMWNRQNLQRKLFLDFLKLIARIILLIF